MATTGAGAEAHMRLDTSAPRRPGGSRAGRWLVAGVAAGLVLAMVGTFLPWLQSGSVARNSYAAGGAIRRILGLDGALGAVVAAWPFLGVLCGVALALLMLGHVRAGGVLAALCAVASGAVSIAVLASSGSALIHAATAGPVSTLAGSALVVVTVLITFVAGTVGASPLTSSARRPR